jgi:hypothetical protein
MTGPERQARAIARGQAELAPRKLAKLAGVRVELAHRILRDVQRRRQRR